MEHASAGSHAARRNDDRRRPHIVDFFRIVDRAHVVHGVRVERIPVLFLRRKRQIVVFVVAQI